MSLKSRLRKVVKKVGRGAGTVLRTVAPAAPLVFGAATGGLLGGGAALLGSALKGGNRTKKAKAFKRAAVQVGGATAATALVGAISGAGAGANILESGKAIFASKDATGQLTAVANGVTGPTQSTSSAQQTSQSFEQMLRSADPQTLFAEEPATEETLVETPQTGFEDLIAMQAAEEEKKKKFMIGAAIVLGGFLLFGQSKRKK